MELSRSVDSANGFVAPIAARVTDWRTAATAGMRDQGVTQFGFVGLLAATVFVTMMAAGDNVLSFDVAISRFVQNTGLPGLHHVAMFVSFTGGTIPMFAVGGLALLWLARSGHYVAMIPVIAALVLRIGNALIKTTADSPRPTSDFVRTLENPSGNGFPSAHTMGVVLLYGVLLVLATELIGARAVRLPIQIVSAAMIVIVGPGRIYTGAHWPTDVIGAYLYGVLFLIPLLVAYQTLSALGPISVSIPRPSSLLRLATVSVSRKS